MVYISYNTGTRALPDIYALTLECCVPSGIIHIYQATHSCLCYNLHKTHLQTSSYPILSAAFTYDIVNIQISICIILFIAL